MIVKNAMNPKYATISPKSNLLTAAEKMVKEDTPTLFVVTDDGVIGVVGIRDLFTCPISASSGRSMPIHTEDTLIQKWQSTLVEDMMSIDVLSVNEDFPLMQAAALMTDYGKHPLAVKKGKDIVGIIDRVDIVQYLLRLDVKEKSAIDQKDNE